MIEIFWWLVVGLVCSICLKFETPALIFILSPGGQARYERMIDDMRRISYGDLMLFIGGAILAPLAVVVWMITTAVLLAGSIMSVLSASYDGLSAKTAFWIGERGDDDH